MIPIICLNMGVKWSRRSGLNKHLANENCFQNQSKMRKQKFKNHFKRDYVMNHCTYEFNDNKMIINQLIKKYDNYIQT